MGRPQINGLQTAMEDRADAQEGLLRRADLLELGLGSQAIQHRVRLRRLFVHHRGVYSLGPGPFPRPTAWLAAVWAIGGDATLSHFAAGAFHGHGEEPTGAPVHVTTTQSRASFSDVVVHRTQCLERLDWSQHGLLRVTNRSRTLVDEASLLPFSAFRARADRLKALPLRELEATLRRAPGRPGSVAAARLLRGEQRHTRSELERRHLRFCDRIGLPHPDGLNQWVAGHKVDCVHRAARLLLELDGRAYHERRAQMVADDRRNADYQLAGWRILRLTWWDHEPEWEARTAETIRAFLALT